MTRAIYRKSRATWFTKIMSMTLAVVFTLSFTGVVHAMVPAGEVAEQGGESVFTQGADVVSEPVAEAQVKEPAADEEPVQPDEAVAAADEAVSLPQQEDEDAEKGMKASKPEKSEKDSKPSEVDEAPLVELPDDPGGYTTQSGNPALCPGGLKIDPAKSGTYYHMVGEIEVEIVVEIVKTDDGPIVSWSTDHPVTKVIVKGGPDANVYAYAGMTSGSGLHAPLNPSNKWAGVSWLGFCFQPVGGGGGPVVGTGTVCVYKYNDLNGNGLQDDGEGPLSGWTFHLMDGDTIIDTMTTGESGYAEFADVPHGDYTVHEVEQDGWQVTTGSYSQAVTVGTSVVYVVFGNRMVELEPDLVEKRFRLDTAPMLTPAPSAIEVDYVINGITSTVPLHAQGDGIWLSGPYLFDSGTTIDAWSIHAVVDGVRWPVPLFASATPEVLMTADGPIVNAATYIPASIIGSKALDTNRDGIADVVPAGMLGGWAFALNGDVATTLSDADGMFAFAGLLPGTYSVSELMTDTQAELYDLISPLTGVQTVTVVSGQNVMLDPFVNQPVPPSISIQKDASVLTAIPGDTITYTFTVSNTGPWTLDPVVVSDDMLPGAGAVAVPALAPAGTAGDSFTFTVDYTIPADQAEGPMTNLVTVTGEDIFGEIVTDTDTAVVEIEPFLPFTEIDIVKTADVDTVLAGGVINYTVTVTNVSGATIQGFSVVDDYPSDLVTVTNAGGGVVDAGFITWQVTEPLAENESVTFNYTVVVNEDVPAATRIVNVVTVPEFDVSDSAVVVVSAPFLPFTPQPVVGAPVTPAEPFLPFTGAGLLGLLAAAAGAVTLGVALRRFGRETASDEA